MSISQGQKIVASDVTSHINNKSNPHAVTAAQVGAAASSHNHAASNITSGTLPVERGGTGVTSLDALKEALGISNLVSLIGVIGATITITWKNYDTPKVSISAETITLPANTQYVTLSGVATSTLYPGESCSGSCVFGSSSRSITVKYTTSNTITISIKGGSLGGSSGTSTHTVEINCFG